MAGRLGEPATPDGSPAGPHGVGSGKCWKSLSFPLVLSSGRCHESCCSSVPFRSDARGIAGLLSQTTSLGAHGCGRLLPLGGRALRLVPDHEG